jgi:iron complex transport system ATP-binding protein
MVTRGDQDTLTKTSQVFSLDHVSFGYPRAAMGAAMREQCLIFDDLTAAIAAGQMLGIIGPNGSGKSTFLKLLAGIVRPDKGTIHLYGRDVRHLSSDALGKLLAYVPQEFQITFPFTVQDIVLMGRYPHRRGGLWDLWGWESGEDYAAAERGMAELNVLHLADHAIGELSGGERQRALIARALAQEPDILLLDEPTAFLDLNYQLEISRILHRLVRERSLTIILVSHDLNLASQYCDRLLLLDRGRLVASDHPRSVLRPDVLEPVYGCRILIDCHPETGLPRVTLPGRPVP